MKKLAMITFLAMVFVSSAAGASIFSLDAEIYENNTVNLNSFNITNGETSEKSSGEYQVRTVNADGETLTSRNFTIAYTILYNINPNVTSTENQTSPTSSSRRKLLRLPYSYEAESINILQSGEEIYSLNIPERVCRNNDDNCPEYCQGKGIDSDCEKSKTENEGLMGKLLDFLSTLI